MPRQARLDTPGTLHHVMIRGIERSPIFRDEQDRQDFISRAGILTQGTGTKIAAWALMSNHVHLLFFSIKSKGTWIKIPIRKIYNANKEVEGEGDLNTLNNVPDPLAHLLE
jgi:hypothetical protein